jgi:hypothetical protein
LTDSSESTFVTSPTIILSYSSTVCSFSYSAALKITTALLKQLDAQLSYVPFLKNLHFVLYFFFIFIWTSSCTSDSVYFKASGVRQGVLDIYPQEAVFSGSGPLFCVRYRRNNAEVVHTCLLIGSCMAWFWCTWSMFP